MLYRRLTYIGIFGVTIITIRNLKIRYSDRIEEKDEFSIYTNEQQKKYIYSGMHEPFITNNIEELNLFNSCFPEYKFLIGKNLNEIKEKHSLKNSVSIKCLSEYKNEKIDLISSTLIVGGPPALISSFKLLKNQEDLIYLNDFERIGISNGSAWHLEPDAQTEAPTNYKPTKFIFDQIKRLLLMNVT
jgi:hypothetical protein